MSVACDLITLRVTGHAEPRGCEQGGSSEPGRGADYLGVNSELQKVSFMLNYCFSTGLSVDSHIFDGLKSQRVELCA